MAIQFRCPACGQLMSIASRMAGKDVPCPVCKMHVMVPDEEEADSPAFEADDFNEPGVSVEEQQVEEHAFDQDLDDVDVDSNDFGKPSFDESPVAENVEVEEPSHVLANVDEEESEFTIRKPSTDFEELDLTPMVDVTFLLLIFFMITASFSVQKSIEIPPPEPEQQGAQQTPDLEELEQNSIFVQIDAENRIFVEDEEVASLPEIPRKLADLRNESDRNEIVIMPDDLARHEIVVEVIDAANEVRMQRIRIASRKQEG